jgi:hypothetical protein
MSRAEGPNRDKNHKRKKWHEKRMRKKEDTCEIRCSRIARARKASRRKRRPPQVIYPSSHGVITLQ